jgi:hypothetical protein
LLRYVVWAGALSAAVALGLAGSTLLSSENAAPAPAPALQAAQAAPPAEEGPIIRETVQADLDLSMVIQPGYAGDNDLAFYMIDTDRDWKDVERFNVRFTYLDGKVERAYDLTQLHEGHFPLDHLDLPYAGRWAVDVDIVRAEVGENRFNFNFVLGHRSVSADPAQAGGQ